MYVSDVSQPKITYFVFTFFRLSCSAQQAAEENKSMNWFMKKDKHAEMDTTIRLETKAALDSGYNHQPPGEDDGRPPPPPPPPPCSGLTRFTGMNRAVQNVSFQHDSDFGGGGDYSANKNSSYLRSVSSTMDFLLEVSRHPSVWREPESSEALSGADGLTDILNRPRYRLRTIEDAFLLSEQLGELPLKDLCRIMKFVGFDFEWEILQSSGRGDNRLDQATLANEKRKKKRNRRTQIIGGEIQERRQDEVGVREVGEPGDVSEKKSKQNSSNTRVKVSDAIDGSRDSFGDMYTLEKENITRNKQSHCSEQNVISGYELSVPETRDPTIGGENTIAVGVGFERETEASMPAVSEEPCDGARGYQVMINTERTGREPVRDHRLPDKIRSPPGILGGGDGFGSLEKSTVESFESHSNLELKVSRSSKTSSKGGGLKQCRSHLLGGGEGNYQIKPPRESDETKRENENWSLVNIRSKSFHFGDSSELELHEMSKIGLKSDLHNVSLDYRESSKSLKQSSFTENKYNVTLNYGHSATCIQQPVDDKNSKALNDGPSSTGLNQSNFTYKTLIFSDKHARAADSTNALSKPSTGKDACQRAWADSDSSVHDHTVPRDAFEADFIDNIQRGNPNFSKSPINNIEEGNLYFREYSVDNIQQENLFSKESFPRVPVSLSPKGCIGPIRSTLTGTATNEVMNLVASECEIPSKANTREYRNLCDLTESTVTTLSDALLEDESRWTDIESSEIAGLNTQKPRTSVESDIHDKKMAQVTGEYSELHMAYTELMLSSSKTAIPMYRSRINSEQDTGHGNVIASATSQGELSRRQAKHFCQGKPHKTYEVDTTRMKYTKDREKNPSHDILPIATNDSHTVSTAGHMHRLVRHKYRGAIADHKVLEVVSSLDKMALSEPKTSIPRNPREGNNLSPEDNSNSPVLHKSYRTYPLTCQEKKTILGVPCDPFTEGSLSNTSKGFDQVEVRTYNSREAPCCSDTDEAIELNQIAHPTRPEVICTQTKSYSQYPTRWIDHDKSTTKVHTSETTPTFTLLPSPSPQPELQFPSLKHYTELQHGESKVSKVGTKPSLNPPKGSPTHGPGSRRAIDEFVSVSDAVEISVSSDKNGRRENSDTSTQLSNIPGRFEVFRPVRSYGLGLSAMKLQTAATYEEQQRDHPESKRLRNSRLANKQYREKRSVICTRWVEQSYPFVCERERQKVEKRENPDSQLVTSASDVQRRNRLQLHVQGKSLMHQSKGFLNKDPVSHKRLENPAYKDRQRIYKTSRREFTRQWVQRHKTLSSRGQENCQTYYDRKKTLTQQELKGAVQSNANKDTDSRFFSECCVPEYSPLPSSKSNERRKNHGYYVSGLECFVNAVFLRRGLDQNFNMQDEAPYAENYDQTYDQDQSAPAAEGGMEGQTEVPPLVDSSEAYTEDTGAGEGVEGTVPEDGAPMAAESEAADGWEHQGRGGRHKGGKKPAGPKKPGILSLFGLPEKKPKRDRWAQFRPKDGKTLEEDLADLKKVLGQSPTEKKEEEEDVEVPLIIVYFGMALFIIFGALVNLKKRLSLDELYESIYYVYALCSTTGFGDILPEQDAYLFQLFYGLTGVSMFNITVNATLQYMMATLDYLKVVVKKP